MKSLMKLTTAGLMLMMLACGGGGGGGQTIADADALFVAGNYSGAFALYISFIPDNGGQALVGAGWCDLRLNSYAQADSFFTAAAADSLPDGYAGWSFTSWVLNSPQKAIDNAAFVLIKAPNYSFSLDSRVDKDHLIWIQAESYLELQNYQACIDKIVLLDGGFTATASDPNIANILAAKLQTLGAAS